MRVWQVYRENRENAVLLPLPFISRMNTVHDRE